MSKYEDQKDTEAKRKALDAFVLQYELTPAEINFNKPKKERK